MLPREQGDERDAKSLSAILPVILERNDYEQIYSDAWWDKLKSGTAAYGVFWDKRRGKRTGRYRYPQYRYAQYLLAARVTDIQESPHLYIVALVDNDTLLAQYPQLQGKLGGQAIDVPDISMTIISITAINRWWWIGTIKSTAMAARCCTTANFAPERSCSPVRAILSMMRAGIAMANIRWCWTCFPHQGFAAGFGYVDIMRDPQLYIDSLDEIILNNARLAGSRVGLSAIMPAFPRAVCRLAAAVRRCGDLAGR